MRQMHIGKHKIGVAHPPFVIAEMSGNHNGSLDRALQIVDAIADSGAHALKLQTYTADTMTIDLAEREFVITDKKSLWYGRSLYDLYKEAHTPWGWHGAIFDRARARGLVAFSTPFDATAVDFLESLDVPCYKIASFENVDLPLVQRVARTGKPLIISTGLATLEEIRDAVATAREAGCKDLILLKCTSNYPASPKDSHLRTIAHIREEFGCEVGVSDHTLGIGAALAAVALGATVIEKHVTLFRADGGVDSAFSLEPRELSDLVRECQTASQSVGSIHFGPTEAEKGSLIFRRSLYVVADVKRGERLDAANLRAIRPGLGLAPKYLPKILGRRAAKDVLRGTPVSWDLVD
jgi:pseudaminic acid synthase